jgi:hypothetical protein
MAVQITIDQGVLPPGTPGKAREDLSTGLLATLSSSGGPFAQYLWRILHPAVDIDSGVKATSILATPTAPSTQINPIDVEGTYLIELVVDSGNGLGAGVDDVARITFYAGTALAANPWDLPRRGPAFKETIEHNVNDAIDVTGNTEGYSREFYRWFALIRRMYAAKNWAAARIALPGGGPAAITRGTNIASATRTGVGVVDIVFTTAMPDGNYSVIATPRTSSGSIAVSAEAVGGFTVTRYDSAGAPADADFNFAVQLGT